VIPCSSLTNTTQSFLRWTCEGEGGECTRDGRRAALESPEARALLPAQLYLAWPGRHSFRTGRAAGGDAAETRQLQTFRELSEEWVDLALELEQLEREQSR